MTAKKEIPEIRAITEAYKIFHEFFEVFSAKLAEIELHKKFRRVRS